MTDPVYDRRPIRRRATSDEMAERAEMLMQFASDRRPCSVRHLFYLAVSNDVPGITKDDNGYRKVQLQVLELRRSGQLPYELISDASRWRQGIETWRSPAEAVRNMAGSYRRDLWAHTGLLPEVWCESDSIAGVISPVVAEWAVDLMSCRGDASDSFAWEAAEVWKQSGAVPVVFYVGDHDGAGLHIEQVLRSKLEGFYGRCVRWERVGITLEQAREHDLPSQPAQPKDKKRGYELAEKWEAEALPPDVLRDVLTAAISELVDPEQLGRIYEQQSRDRGVLRELADSIEQGGAT